MTPLEQEDAQMRAQMQSLARYIFERIPPYWCFILLTFPFGKDGRTNYVSNAKREDVVRALYEFIEATKAQWGVNVPDDRDARAEDEQIARLRQRVAELEYELAKRNLKR